MIIYIRPKSKKYSCFQKCGWREKSSPGGLQIYFFNRFSGDILSSSLVSLAFFVFLLFFFLLVCLFFEIKNIYSDTHLTIERVNDKKFLPGRFPGTRLLFFGFIYPEICVMLVFRCRYAIIWKILYYTSK